MTADPSALPALDDVVRLSAEVIGVRSLTAESNFFEVGGDSITAARLAVMLEEQWDLPVDVFAIMAAEDLGEIHEGLMRSARVARTGAGPAPAATRTPSLNQQVRLQMDAETAAVHGHRNVHTLAIAFRTPTTNDPARLGRALRAVARRHEPLRSVFPSTDAVRVLEDPEPALTVRDIDSCAERAVRDTLTGHAATAFDLGAAPPWSVLVLRHRGHCQVVSFAFDHLLLDAESMPVLLRDLEVAYEGDAPLEPLQLSYFDWSDRQRSDQLPAALADAAALARPDNPGGGVLPRLRLTIEQDLGASRLGRTRRTVLAGPVAALSAVAAEQHATLLQALVLCYATAVDRVRVPGPLGVVLPVANRSVETRDMVGWVANMTYLPLELDPAGTTGTRLAAVRRAFAGLSGTATVPLRVLQEHLWRGPEPLTRFPGLFVDFLRETPTDRRPWRDTWERIELEAPAFLLPGLSLWLRHRLDGSMDLTLAYDAGRLTAAAAESVLADVEREIRSCAATWEDR